MPRTARSPYLYLKPADVRNNATWVIRDRGKMTYTGAAEGDDARAKEALTEYLRIHHPVAPEPQRAPNTVYFATCDVPDFPIKIGISSSPVWRLHKMQTSMPYDVVLLGVMPGDLSAEKMLHLDFRHLRLRGEWFRRDPSILEFVANNCRSDRMNVTKREHASASVLKIADYSRS